MSATTFEKAAVYAVSQDTALLRLQSEYNVLLAQKRLSDARGVALAMQILRRLDVHVISQADWRESRR
ncbi:hypothetical protein [Faecalibacterium sp. i20-0019-C2]|uniref:hypothetical protein n=1 Tax=unclassified Faecalibacterium TaxID=2646395 RepID=UPI0034B8CD2E